MLSERREPAPVTRRAAARAARPLPPVGIEPPSPRRQGEFLAAVRASRALHGSLIAPPSTPARYRTYLRRCRSGEKLGHFVCTAGGELAGVININGIVRGAVPSASLGYYALVPHAGRGCLRAGLAQVLRLAFCSYGLHRLEASIQPGNARSIALVAGLGFRREGGSRRDHEQAGCWRDHERWALTIEDWRGPEARRSRPPGPPASRS